MRQQDYSEYIFFLARCTRTVLGYKIGYAISRKTVKPWSVVKKNTVVMQGWEVLQQKYLKNVIVSAYFTSNRSKQLSEDSRYVLD